MTKKQLESELKNTTMKLRSAEQTIGVLQNDIKNLHKAVDEESSYRQRAFKSTIRFPQDDPELYLNNCLRWEIRISKFEIRQARDIQGFIQHEIRRAAYDLTEALMRP